MTTTILDPKSATIIDAVLEDLMGWKADADSYATYDAEAATWTIKVWHIETPDGTYDLYTCEDRGERHAADTLAGVLTQVFAKDYAFAAEQIADDFDQETADLNR
jgi:hypothetical protein